METLYENLTTIYSAKNISMGKQNLTIVNLQNTRAKQTDVVEAYNEVIIILWIVGILASFLGLLLQVTLFTLVRKGRKFDEIIVCQMTLARALYTALEYYFAWHVQYVSHVTKLLILFFYIYFDVVSLMLMFVFTKNLYNKVVIVFPLKSYNLFVVSASVWIISIPVGILCPVTLSLRNGYFSIFYKVYASIKFFICGLNALIFIRIIRVSFKTLDKHRHIKDFLKTALMAFILVTVTCLQVLVTDIISVLYDSIQSDLLSLVFGVVYSYQACIDTGIFIVLIKSKISSPIARLFSVRFNVGLSISSTTTTSN